MGYSNEARPVLDGFHDRRREHVIRAFIAEANRCRPGTPTYVMTTGYGAVAPNEAKPLYNVPGERAIRRPEFLAIYRQSLLAVLPPGRLVVAYYAGCSKDPFRRGVFDLLKCLGSSPPALDIRACMYGARRHVSDRGDILCAIFRALEQGDEAALVELRQGWLADHPKLAAFLQWF